MDKFGHYKNKRFSLPESFETFDKAFIKGEIDIQSNRLTGVKSPLKANDAANKEYVDMRTESFTSKEEVYDIIDTIKSDLKTYIKLFIEDYCTNLFQTKTLIQLKNE